MSIHMVSVVFALTLLHGLMGGDVYGEVVDPVPAAPVPVSPVPVSRAPSFSPFMDGDRIVCFGDSITQFGDGPQGYVGMLRTAFAVSGHPAVTVINAGISGNKVSNLVGRLESDVLRQSPTVVVIYIGINDVWHNKGNLGEPRTAFIAGLRTIIESLKSRGIVMVLATPTVIGEKPNGGNELDVALDAFADSSRSLAKEYGIELCDLRAAFTERLNAAARAGEKPPALTGDGVHLSAAGNAVVAEEITKSLRQALEHAGPQVGIRGGDFVGATTVAIALRNTPAATGLVIHCTQDGSDPSVSSSVYTQPLTLTHTATISARAFRGSTAVGNRASITCVKHEPQAAVTPGQTVPGLAWALYEGTFEKLPAFATLTPTEKGVAPIPDLASVKRELNYALRFTGFISVPQTGVYTFGLTSDDGSRLVVGDTVVIDNDGQHGNKTIAGTVPLSAGSHRCEIQFFQSGGGASLALTWSALGAVPQAVPATAFTSSP